MRIDVSYGSSGLIMSAWNDVREGIRRAILMQERVERVIAGLEKIEARVIDHERRLVRIETMIELAQRGRLGRRPPSD
jgi:hypothetical protein